MFTLHGVLRPAGRYSSLVYAAPGPDGEMVVLWADAAGAAALQQRFTAPTGVSYVESRTAAPVAVRITVHRVVPNSEREVRRVSVVKIPKLPVAHPLVQPLPDGRMLVVGSRCRWSTREGPEQNAIVVDRRGRVVRLGTLGDGIGHLQTTPSGRIWVGYFDEGIGGAYGWAGPGPDPVGAPGLVRFDPATLEPDWWFPPNVIWDCYALNVVGETAWTCYYDQFPVARVRDGEVSWWETPASGISRMLVDEDDDDDDESGGGGGDAGHDGARVALTGVHGNPKRVVHGRLSEGALRISGRARIRWPFDADPASAFLHTRGDVLHMVIGDAWCTARMTDIIAAG